MLRPAVLAALFCLTPLVAAIAAPLEPVLVDDFATEVVHEDYTQEWAAFLRQERTARIARLSAYARAGDFPKKAAADGFFHSFLDADGTPCAVADLMWHSGHADLVRQTAATRNDVVLSEVDEGPLVDWMLTSGLTREEIAVIQVPGFNARVLEKEVVQPIVQAPRDRTERRRVRAHLTATIALLQVDTEASIFKATERLGDRVNQPPPVVRL